MKKYHVSEKTVYSTTKTANVFYQTECRCRTKALAGRIAKFFNDSEKKK